MSGENRYSSWSGKTTPASKQPPIDTEEKLFRHAYWKRNKDSLKASLTSTLGREPSEQEVREAFEMSMRVMQKSGALQDILNTYRQSMQEEKGTPFSRKS